MSAPQIPSIDKEHPRMRRVDLTNDNLTYKQRHMIDSYNRVQLTQFRKSHRSRNGLLGLGIVGVIASVYGYTMYQMSRDNLIGELEEEVKKLEY